MSIIEVCINLTILFSDVQGRFQFECDLIVKPCTSTKLVDRIKSLTSRNNLSESDEEDEDLTIRGRLVLDSGDEPLSSFANKGIGRYTIQTSTLLAFELTVAFWLEENNDSVHDDDNVYTPIDQDVLRYCQAGDYLTLYVKGESYPVRYHVSFIYSFFVLLNIYLDVDSILGVLPQQPIGLATE